MKTIRFTLPLAALLILCLATGCGHDDGGVLATAPSGDDFANLDLADPYGGLSATDEEEAFGDEGLKAMMLAEEGEVVHDPLADDPRVQQFEAMGRHVNEHHERDRPRFTYVRLRWGMLRGPEDTTRVEGPCAATDWTGEIHTDRGLVVVRRTIRFEPGQDHVVFPRLDPRTVAFVSRTNCGLDGLLLQIIERPDTSAAGDIEEAAPNRLHVNAGPFQGVYLVEELSGLNEVNEVGDGGNRFQVEGFTLHDIGICPKGFLSGRYRLVPPDTMGAGPGEIRGHFAGAWRDLEGRIVGFMRGGYGIGPGEEHVLVGKLIDRRGRFRGLLAGTWEPGGRDGALATFKGRWGNRREGTQGLMGGQAHPVEGYPGGFFTGRWTASCDEEAEDALD
jgi:hypothetical protein